MKTSELSGADLDRAVAKCIGLSHALHGHVPYTTDWAHGGPIIERERLNLSMSTTAPWMSWIYDGLEMIFLVDGPTPLVAAMRCFVASKLGDTVEIPEGLQ